MSEKTDLKRKLREIKRDAPARVKRNPRHRSPHMAEPGQPTLRQLRKLQADFDYSSPGAQKILKLRGELESHLGGAENLSAQKRIMVDHVTRLMFFIDSADQYLFSRGDVLFDYLNEKRLLAVVLERTRLADSLVGYLKLLGLEKQVKRIATIEELNSGAILDKLFSDPITVEASTRVTDGPSVEEILRKKLDIN